MALASALPPLPQDTLDKGPNPSQQRKMASMSLGSSLKPWFILKSGLEVELLKEDSDNKDEK